LLLLPRIASMDCSILPPQVQRHWREVFLAIECELRQRVGDGEADRALAAVFLGTAPEYQGRGLAGQLIKHLSGPAYEHGYDSYWSLSANPTAMRCAGSVGQDLSLAARAMDRVFQLPSRRVANNLALPLLQAAGGLPRGWFSFFVNGKNVPGVQAVPSLVLVTKAAIPRPKPTLTSRL